MAPKNTRVAFGRVNRRRPAEATLQSRPFAEDMKDLADSHLTQTTVYGKHWRATDFELRNNGDALVGILGFDVLDERRSFAEDDFSWLKGETYMVQGALPETLVPFAVDLREHNRWVAVATSPRIQHNAFAVGFAAVLNQAVLDLGLFPTDWEVDMVTNRSDVLEWIARHPTIKTFKRIVKFSNPGLDLDEDHAAMRALGATVKEEEYRALGGNSLRLKDNPAFTPMLDGIERGDLQVQLSAETGGVKQRYSSKNRPDETFVSRFDNLIDGRERALDALMVYSSQQSTDTP